MLQRRALTFLGCKGPLQFAARCFLATESGNTAKKESKFELTEMSGWSKVVLSQDPVTSLAHSISADFDMADGIAVNFREKFGDYNDLIKKGLQFQNDRQVGDIAVFKRNESSFVYYLLTRENWWDHATPSSMRACLEQLRNHCEEHGVEKLAVPRLGTGWDKIDWPYVKRIVEDVFKDTDISITAYTSK